MIVGLSWGEVKMPVALLISGCQWPLDHWFYHSHSLINVNLQNTITYYHTAIWHSVVMGNFIKWHRVFNSYMKAENII